MTSIEAEQVRLVLAVLVPAEPLLMTQAPASETTPPSPSQGKAGAGNVPPPPVHLRPSEVETLQRFLDPYYDAALHPSAVAWVEMELGTEEPHLKIDIPHRDPDDLLDLLETLYIVQGWGAVDDLIERVSRSLVTTVSGILRLPQDELSALTLLTGRNRPIYVPPEHTELVGEAIGGLIQLAEKRPWPRVVDGLKALVPTNGLFAGRTPQAITDMDIAANPEVAVRLFADVLVALARARRRLRDDVVAALLRTELEARRQLLSTITDSRATICREAIGYFGLYDEDSAGMVLSALSAGIPTAPRTSQAQGHASSGLLVHHAEGLQSALRSLVPFAGEVLRLQRLARRQTPTPRRMVEEELSRARVTYGHELGRHAQEFPVLSKLAVEDVEEAANAGPRLLGDHLWPLLRDAYLANRAMSARLARSLVVTRQPDVRWDRHPERATSRLVTKLGPTKTAWGFPKYVERALSRTAGPSDDFTRRAVNDTLDALEVAGASVGEGLAQATGEMFVLEMTSHLLPRFIPALNVMLAAWHITSAVIEFDERSDEFLCSLDPRDAFIEAAPSVSGLVFEIATEAAFSFI